MPYYPELNILFIHIPKTGGSNIETEIQKFSKQTLYSGFTNDILPSPFNTISLQHQYYRTLYECKDICKISFENIKIFSIVRNPYDRIISDLFWWNMIDVNSTSDQVYKIIKEKYVGRNNLDNHNVPQYEFLIDETGRINSNIIIYKTEHLNNSNDDINTFLKLKLNVESNHKKKNYFQYLNEDSINLINTFYLKDFEYFSYPMIEARKVRHAYILCEHENTPRCIDSRKVLESIGFVVHCIPYIRHGDKIYSNKISMQHIYQMVIDSEEKWSYIFEDDINKIYDVKLDEIIEYESISDDLFYLGACFPENIINDYDSGLYNSGKKIGDYDVRYVSDNCFGLHGVAFSKEGMKKFLEYSNISFDSVMDVTLKKFTSKHPANIVRFDLCSPHMSSHRGVIYQDRDKYPTTI